MFWPTHTHTLCVCLEKTDGRQAVKYNFFRRSTLAFLSMRVQVVCDVSRPVLMAMLTWKDDHKNLFSSSSFPLLDVRGYNKRVKDERRQDPDKPSQWFESLVCSMVWTEASSSLSVSVSTLTVSISILKWLFSLLLRCLDLLVSFFFLALYEKTYSI